jgi:hypothetical protein
VSDTVTVRHETASPAPKASAGPESQTQPGAARWEDFLGDFTRGSTIGKPPSKPRDQDALWQHVEAIITAKLKANPDGKSRVKRAMALLFHSDGQKGSNDEANLLGRANNLIDELAPRISA